MMTKNDLETVEPQEEEHSLSAAGRIRECVVEHLGGIEVPHWENQSVWGDQVTD